MARKKTAARKSTEPPRVTEEEVDEALRVLRRDYYQDVRSVGNELARQIKDKEITTREEFYDRLPQAVADTQRIIYTFQARIGLLCTEYPDEFEEEYGDKPESPEQALQAAMERDVREYMEREHEKLLAKLED